jgi:hypothetical protein
LMNGKISLILVKKINKIFKVKLMKLDQYSAKIVSR